MAKSTSSNRTSRAKRSREKDCHHATASGEVRIDAPHNTPGLGSDEMDARISVASASVPVAAPLDDNAAAQMELQAVQLATLLRERQRDLDHREAELHSQAARLDAEARATRLWLDEQRAEWTLRGDQVVHKEQELVARTEAIAKREGTVARKQDELAQRERQVAQLERTLAEREQQLSRREQAVGLRECELEHRAARLEDANAGVITVEADASDSEQLRNERLWLADQKMRIEHATAALDLQRQALARRSEQVDQATSALARLREDLSRIHRETLEVRLVTEELWAQLAAAAPPAALTQSLGQIRSQLAEQYDQTKRELAQQKEELATTRNELAVQYERLVEQKSEVERWMAASREDCHRQAERIRQREQLLRRDQLRLREQLQRWDAERLRYDDELQRLRALASASLIEATDAAT